MTVVRLPRPCQRIAGRRLDQRHQQHAAQAQADKKAMSHCPSLERNCYTPGGLPTAFRRILAQFSPGRVGKEVDKSPYRMRTSAAVLVAVVAACGSLLAQSPQTQQKPAEPRPVFRA